METANETRFRRLPKFVRILRARPRLFMSAIVGLIIVMVLPADWRAATRMLVGWDVGVGLYLVVAYEMMARADIGRIRRRAALQDEGRVVILVLVVAAALASLGAIIVDLGVSSASAGRPPGRLALAMLTVLLSWALIHTIFALHYAHEFYHEGRSGGGGLTFPGGEEPDYGDFIYFSLVVGMTSQVSDVAVTSRRIRRTVAAHGLISFLFNAALIALTVNVAASALVG